MLWIPFILALAHAGLHPAVVHAQTPAAASTMDRQHRFVQHGEALYQRFVRAEAEGDAEAFRRVRTAEVYSTAVGHLKKLGRPPGDLGPMLKQMAGLQPDLSQYAFVRSDAKGDAARLLYTRDTLLGTQPRREFVVLMLRWEGGAWRLGWVARVDAPRVQDGKEYTPDELLSQPQFTLE